MNISTYQRQDGLWCAKVRINGKSIVKYSKDKNEAFGKAYDHIRKYERGELLASDKITFKDFFEIWIDTYCVNLSPTTIKNYRSHTSLTTVL